MEKYTTIEIRGYGLPNLSWAPGILNDRGIL